MLHDVHSARLKEAQHARLSAVCVAVLLVLSAMLIALPAWSANLGNFTGGGQKVVHLPEVSPGFGPDDEWLEEWMSAEKLGALFARMRIGIHFEPYRGILRGPRGTALSHKGNALDQALLLKKVLDMKGYHTRLVEGTLGRENAQVLLRGLYPPAVPAYGYGQEYSPFHPETDALLLENVRKHYWVELKQGDGSWLPLDPSFPRAKIGEAYAKAEHYYNEPRKEWNHNISVRLLQETADKRTKVLFHKEQTTSAWGYVPVYFMCTAIPLEKANKPSKNMGSAARLFGGALSGGTSSRKDEAPEAKPERLGMRYQWSIYVPGEGVVNAEHDVLDGRTGTDILREWIEITVRDPGGKERKAERVLFEAGDAIQRPSGYRRYMLMALPGSVRPELAESVRRKFAALPVDRWRKTILPATQNLEGETVNAIDAALSAGLLQTMLLRFASDSDQLTDHVAYRNGVAVSRSLPRVLIASAEMHDGEMVLGMDLRLDEVEAIPFPGAPSKVARLFQMGRGIAESVGEGTVFSSDKGRSSLTTAFLMRQAQARSIGLRVVDRNNLGDFISDAGLPSAVAKRLKASLAPGWEAIIPERAVRIAKSDRWGWWLIEKKSGRTIGVMDNGLHAGMAEYTLSSEDIGLNPNMGFAVGMVVGADSTLFTISGLMLKHGETSAAMIKEVENYLKSVLCHSCPKAEAKASASVTDTGYCLKSETKKELSAKAEFNFCAKYSDGFKCAAGLLLHGVPGPQREYKAEASYEFGCQEGKKEVSRKHAL